MERFQAQGKKGVFLQRLHVITTQERNSLCLGILTSSSSDFSENTSHMIWWTTMQFLVLFVFFFFSPLYSTKIQGKVELY